MYCSSCGVAVTQNLSYCNHCGAKLNRGESLDSSSQLKPQFLISAMVGTFIFGVLVITILMGVMKNAMGLPVERVLGFASVPFLMMLILEGVLLRLLWRTTIVCTRVLLLYVFLYCCHRTNGICRFQSFFTT